MTTMTSVFPVVTLSPSQLHLPAGAHLLPDLPQRRSRVIACVSCSPAKNCWPTNPDIFLWIRDFLSFSFDSLSIVSITLAPGPPPPLPRCFLRLRASGVSNPSFHFPPMPSSSRFPPFSVRIAVSVRPFFSHFSRLRFFRLRQVFSVSSSAVFLLVSLDSSRFSRSNSFARLFHFSTSKPFFPLFAVFRFERLDGARLRRLQQRQRRPVLRLERIIHHRRLGRLW